MSDYKIKGTPLTTYSHLVFFVVLTFIPVTTRAQVLDFQDGCFEVLRYASRDIRIEQRRAQTARYIYDKYCQGTNMKSGINIGVEVDDLLESAGFSLGSSRESVRNVCQTYEERYGNSINQDTRSSIVVREAIDAWMKCKQLAVEGVRIKPNIQETQFTINIQRIIDDITIDGVAYDSKHCKCTARVGESPKKVVVDNNTFHTIRDGNHWNIVCTRIPNEISGAKIYEGFDFAITTSKGSFTLDIERSIMPSLTWAEDIQNEISTLENKVTSLSSRLVPVEKISTQVSNPVPIQVRFTGRQTKFYPNIITWPANLGQPKFVVPSVTGGGMAEVIVTVVSVTPTGASLYVHNPSTGIWDANFQVTVTAYYQQ